MGGTFTDAYALDLDSRHSATAKAPTTPGALSDGILAALDQALQRLEAAPGDVESVLHGTTTATNALLEGDIATTAVVTNTGFEDLLEISRQTRPKLYELNPTQRRPLVAREHRYGIRGRLGPGGSELEPLDEPELDRLGETLRGAGVEAVAICLLHAYANPDHEGQVAEALRAHLTGQVPVVTSHATSPEFREVERMTTTVVNAALRPRMEAYLEALAQHLADNGYDASIQVMDNAGSLLAPREAAQLPVRTVVSGPAGGVAALKQLSQELSIPNLLGVDMGGTSTDASLVLDGEPTRRFETEIAGHRLQVPAADIETVGAGGGSIAWLDASTGLRVGPRSAGARPGPACYDRGGREPTVTDASLVLGHLPAEHALGGTVELAPERAREAIDHVADPLGHDLETTSRAILEIACAHAMRGLRRLTARHGADPGELTLVAFGGAGPLFACTWASTLGIDRVLVPSAAGVASARGMLAAPQRVERATTLLTPLDELDRNRLEDAYAPIDQQAHEALDHPEARVEHHASVRYAGQSHELTVALDATTPQALARAFEASHRATHGYVLAGHPIEVVTLRSRATAPPALSPEPTTKPPEPTPAPSQATQVIHLLDPATEATATLHPDHTLAPGHTLTGPAILPAEGSTTLIAPGWTGRIDPHGHLLLDAEGSP